MTWEKGVFVAGVGICVYLIAKAAVESIDYILYGSMLVH